MDRLTDEQRAYLVDAVQGAVVGCVGMAACWHFFLGGIARDALRAWGVL